MMAVGSITPTRIAPPEGPGARCPAGCGHWIPLPNDTPRGTCARCGQQWERCAEEIPSPRGHDGAGKSWLPIDLGDALNGKTVDEPTRWHRSDGKFSIYSGLIHWFQGEPETLKSMAAQDIVAETIADGGDVLYIDFEDDDRGVVGRLLAMGCEPDNIKAHLTYVRPDEQLSESGKVTAAAIALDSLIESHRYQLAVIDGVTEGMTVEGLALIDNTDIALWFRILPRRIAATGAAVICIDHVTKSSEGRGRFAIGGQHKLAGITGAAFLFTMQRPLSRALGSEPVEAAIGITVVKDRPGYVRGNATDGTVGTLEVTAYPDGALSVSLAAPGETTARIDMVVAERILDYLHDYDGSSSTALKEGVEGKAENILSTVRMMAARGWVHIEKSGRSHLHHLTDTGRRVASGGAENG